MQSMQEVQSPKVKNKRAPGGGGDHQLVKFAFLDLNARAHTQDMGKAVGLAAAGNLTSKTKSTLKKLASRREKKVFVSNTRIESLLTLEMVKKLQARFDKQRPRGQMPLATFIQTLDEILREEYEDSVTNKSFRVELRRWAMSFATKEHDPLGLESGSSRRGGLGSNTLTPATGAAGLSFSTRSLESDVLTGMDGLFVTWSQFTNKLITENQRKELAEDFRTEYKAQYHNNEHLVGNSHFKAAGVALLSTGGDRGSTTIISAPQQPEQPQGMDGESVLLAGSQVSFNGPTACDGTAQVVVEEPAMISKLYSGGRDGLVKLWDPESGDYVKNVFNAGFAWITALNSIQRESFLAITTSDSRLSVLDQTTGAIVRSYLGAEVADNATTTVRQRSTIYTQRYGMLPGECGPRKLNSGDKAKMTTEEYDSRSRAGEVASEPVSATPILGFLRPSATHFFTDEGKFGFGTVDGNLGIVDIAPDLRSAMSIIRRESDAIIPQHRWKPHTDSVTAVQFASRYNSLLSASLDGWIHRFDLNEMKVSTPGDWKPIKPVLGMTWCEELQTLTTWSSDKKVRLWSLIRNEPMHVLEAIPSDIYSVHVNHAKDQLVTLSADRALRIFDLRTLRLLQSLPHQDEWLGDGAGSVVADRTRDTILTVTGRPTIHCLSSVGLGGEASSIGDDPAAEKKKLSAQATVKQVASGKPANANVPVLQRADGAATTSDGRPLADGGPSAPRSAIVRHGYGVNSSLYNPRSRTLFTFDAYQIHVWDVVTGESITSYTVSKQLAPVNASNSLVTTAAWQGGADKGCFLTGTQQSSLVTWNPMSGEGTRLYKLPLVKLPEDLAGDIHCAAARSAASPDVSCIASCANFNVVCRANVGHVIPVQKYEDGGHNKYERVLTVPATTSITSCCITKDNNVVLGTLNGELHFFSLLTNLSVIVPLTKEGGQVCAVESMQWVNKESQGLLYCVLGIGAVVVYSHRLRSVLATVRVFKGGEADLLCSAVSTHQDILFLGDSLGRIFVLDIFGISDNMDVMVSPQQSNHSSNPSFASGMVPTGSTFLLGEGNPNLMSPTTSVPPLNTRQPSEEAATPLSVENGSFCRNGSLASMANVALQLRIKNLQSGGSMTGAPLDSTEGHLLSGKSRMRSNRSKAVFDKKSPRPASGPMGKEGLGAQHISTASIPNRHDLDIKIMPHSTSDVGSPQKTNSTPQVKGRQNTSANEPQRTSPTTQTPTTTTTTPSTGPTGRQRRLSFTKLVKSGVVGALGAQDDRSDISAGSPRHFPGQSRRSGEVPGSQPQPQPEPINQIVARMQLLLGFTACNDAITSIQWLGDVNSFAVTSLDRSVRLYYWEKHNTCHVGDFGDPHRRGKYNELVAGWDINQKSTYSKMPIRSLIDGTPRRNSKIDPTVFLNPKRPASSGGGERKGTTPVKGVGQQLILVGENSVDFSLQASPKAGVLVAGGGGGAGRYGAGVSVDSTGLAPLTENTKGTFFLTDGGGGTLPDRFSESDRSQNGNDEMKQDLDKMAAETDRVMLMRMAQRLDRNGGLNSKGRPSSKTSAESASTRTQSAGSGRSVLSPSGLGPRTFTQQVQVMHLQLSTIAEGGSSRSPRVLELEDKLRAKGAAPGSAPGGAAPGRRTTGTSSGGGTAHLNIQSVSSRLVIPEPMTVCREPHLVLNAPVRPSQHPNTARQFRRISERK